ATGADLRGRIDDELRQQLAEFNQLVPPAERTGPARLEAASRRFVQGQAYHPESRIFAIQVAGGREVTNQREIVENELEDERREEQEDGGERDAGESEGGGGSDGGGESDQSEGAAPGLLDAPEGLATVSTEETGKLRVLTEPLEVSGRQVGTFVAADPLNSVDEALDGLRNTFLVVGALTLALAVAIAVWLAGLISRPLRQMAAVATEVDSGDLSHRIDYRGEDEVGVLAEAFNGMMDRLESGFRQQREFISDASHELRSPLTVLRGRIELLGRRSSDERTNEEADELLREVSRMDRLVEDLLTLAQAGRGTLLQRRRVPLDDLLDDLRRDMPLLGASRFQVDAQAQGTIEVDPDRIAQVLRNLVSNAVRHSGPEGTVRVSVTPANGGARFAVSDDGPGIPPDQLERIFDRFYRTDEGRGRDEGGSGLGLAIARAIVEAHGGRINAESPPGEGATIRFELPGLRPG
ncbi:MAG TPA: HAMP domain-containing sensor histidine kinase, partial [Solirubrobacterales bacterium]|nr:HAMP domain-containing sensor histidine kinase [Solirubrobacterales bacterium]